MIFKTYYVERLVYMPSIEKCLEKVFSGTKMFERFSVKKRLLNRNIFLKGKNVL